MRDLLKQQRRRWKHSPQGMLMGVDLALLLSGGLGACRARYGAGGSERYINRRWFSPKGVNGWRAFCRNKITPATNRRLQVGHSAPRGPLRAQRERRGVCEHLP